MKVFDSLPFCFAFGFAFLLSVNPAEGAARKCRTTPNGLPVNNSEPILVVDGQIVGPLSFLSPSSSESQPGRILVNEMSSVPEDVLRIDIVCLEVSEADRQVGRAAVAVITKAGAVAFMQSHLEALSELQEEYRTRKGTYAQSLVDLDFFTSRAPLPIEFTAHQDEWEAHVQLEGTNTSCHIQGGSQSNLQANQPLNVVRCEAT